MANLGVTYRPANLSEFAGNAAAKKKMQGWMAKPKTMPHAILITGTTGLGKTTLARILGHWVNCERPAADGPCGKCAACQDEPFIEYNAGEKTGKEDMLELIGCASNRGFYGRQVIIIDEVHAVSGAAKTALLKALEDETAPLWLLCTDQPEKLVAATKGRLVQLELRPPSQDDFFDLIADVADAEKLPLTDEQIDALYELHGGNVRLALNSLSSTGSTNAVEVAGLDNEMMADLLAALLACDAAWVVKATHKFRAASGANLIESIQGIRAALDAILLKCAEPNTQCWMPPSAKLLMSKPAYKKHLTVEKLMHLTLAISSAEQHLARIALTPSAERSVFISATMLYLTEHLPD